MTLILPLYVCVFCVICVRVVSCSFTHPHYSAVSIGLSPYTYKSPYWHTADMLSLCMSIYNLCLGNPITPLPCDHWFWHCEQFARIQHTFLWNSIRMTVCWVRVKTGLCLRLTLFCLDYHVHALYNCCMLHICVTNEEITKLSFIHLHWIQIKGTL